MKKNAMTVCLCVALSVSMQAQQKDSLRVIDLETVEVVATRATETTPIAYTNIEKQELERRNHGQDLPFLMSMTPSAITTSDAGTGIGYTTLRVRGTDATRINITANGIPMNDAESHSVFWVNIGDFASSVKDIQVQRGVGTSTNGAGAFGASVNMRTGEFHANPYAELNGSYGSFNTHKETVMAGTGLLNEHWTFDARLSNIGSDGFIDRAGVNLKSYYAQGAYYGDKTSIRLLTFGGKERTYHAWNYASREQMETFGRSFNSCGYMYVTDRNGNIFYLTNSSGAQVNPSIDSKVSEIAEVVKAGGQIHYYPDQTDNYTQRHYQLLLNHDFNGAWNLNAGLHYTKGDGYYQEYKIGRTLSEYGLSPYDLNGETVKKSDLVRKKAMHNWFGGGIFALNYHDQHIQLTIGGGLNRYDGDHFGKVLWVKNYIGQIDPSDDYYFNNATKNDGNLYAKATYTLSNGLSFYGDMQYRHITYKINGEGDNYDWTGRGGMQDLNIHENFDFLNPKLGLNWQLDKQQRVFASFAVANKEPTRNNYTDGKFNEHPKAESLMDYELGYSYAGKCFNAGVNLYYMDYKDQLILTGEVNEIGEALAANVPDSYRAGIELMAGAKLPCGFGWNANATLSRNRIKDFTETLYENEDNTADTWVIKHGDTPIAFSPDFIFNNQFSYTYKGFEAMLMSQYVSKQYMTNSKQADCQLEAYFVSNLDLSYTFKMPCVKLATIGFTVYNLFNEKYETNGFAGSGFYYDSGQKQRYNYAVYSAQAGTNVMCHLSLKF